MTRPRLLNSTLFASTAWVPMTMSILPALHAVPGRLGLRGGDEAGEAADLDREALEAFAEGLEMLAGEQRGRRDQGDLQAGHGGDEGGAQRDLGLAEADVAADQPVHRLAGAEIVDDVVDGAVLVLGLLIRETVGEGGVAGVGLGDRARAERALGGDLDQFAGDRADPLLHPRLAPLPGLAAEPVERDALAVAAVARQYVDILDRDVELVAAGIVSATQSCGAFCTGIWVRPS